MSGGDGHTNSGSFFGAQPVKKSARIINEKSFKNTFGIIVCSLLKILFLTRHLLGHHVASPAVCLRPEFKGHLTVATAAPLPLKYLIHGDGICPCLRYKYLWVTVIAVQPVCVNRVRKDHICHKWHLCLYKDIEIERLFLFCGRV